MAAQRETFGVKKELLKDAVKRELLIKRIKDGGKYPIPPLYVVQDITEKQINFNACSPISFYKEWDEVLEEEWQEKLQTTIEKYPNAEFFDTKEQLLHTLENSP